jgi:NAD(P)-dependent dehydrogenase (short-subunit alcohol dehydrogenase family)
MNDTPKVAIITGASRGIGAGLASAFRGAGYAVVGTALTKGGLNAVTRSLAIKYAAHNVRVNAVALGVIETPMHGPDEYAELARLHPLGRMGRITDVVDGILYLERATFVTGETLHIDGGQAAGH